MQVASAFTKMIKGFAKRSSGNEAVLIVIDFHEWLP